jgi:hypothetical protein
MSNVLKDRELRDLVDHLDAAHDRLEFEAETDDGVDSRLRRAIDAALDALGGAADFLRQVREGVP